MTATPKIGQEIWFVSAHRRNQSGISLTVEKVGRKYFTAGGTQFEIATWREKTDYSPGRAWESEDQWREARTLSIAWGMFTRNVYGMRMPNAMTVEKIQQMRELLGLTAPESGA